MRDTLIYAGTYDGLVVNCLQKDGGIVEVSRGLKGHAVRAIAVSSMDPFSAYIGCGLPGHGLFMTQDAGKSYEDIGFPSRWVWDVLLDPMDPNHFWVGTEPPMVYVTHDGGHSFDSSKNIDFLPSRASWTFFHPPFYAGHIHGFARHPKRPARIFGGVEHGAIVRSLDGGESWEECCVGTDLHRIAIDPSNPDRVMAGLGSGLLISEDAGLTWEVVKDLRGKYVHGILFDHDGYKRVYVYVNDCKSPLFKSEDGGATWSPIGNGLPTAHEADNLASDADGTLFYAGDIGPKTSRVYQSIDQGRNWHALPGTLPKVWRLRIA